VSAPNVIRPLRDQLYVERIRESHYANGVILKPETFKAGKNGFSARERVNGVADYFPARVLACGPDVRELSQGDEVLVWSYAEGDGSKLYTGESVGEKNKLFIKLDDVVCAVER
jgi:co-chaperonin GroES (HSP10)